MSDENEIVLKSNLTTENTEDAVAERYNGVKSIDLDFLYKKESPRDLTEKDAQEILTSILKIRTSQLSKSMYFAMEILHHILRTKTNGEVKFREECMRRLKDHSISWATQHLEMIGDFNEFGQLNGVLEHYYQLCWTDDDEPAIKAQADFINLVIVHAYITGRFEWLSAIFVDIEEYSQRVNCDRRIRKFKDLIFELSQHRPKVWDAIDREREYREDDNHIPINKMYIANPVTADPIVNGGDLSNQHCDNGDYIKFRAEHIKVENGAEVFVDDDVPIVEDDTKTDSEAEEDVVNEF